MKFEKHNDYFYTNLVYFIIVVLFVGLRICSSMKVFSFLGESGEIVLTLITQVGLMFLLPLFLFSKLSRKTKKQVLRDYSFNKINYKTVLVSILIGVIVFILNIAISTFFNYILTLLGYYNYGVSSSGNEPTWASFFISILTVAVLPAICEEFTHRGLLLQGFKTLGFKKAVWYSALMFGLIHLNVGQFFYATIIGLVLAVVTLYSRSIVPAMIIHFMNNGINVYLDFAQAKGLFGQNFYESITNYLANGSLFTIIIFVSLLISLLVVLLLYLIGWLLKQNAEKSFVNFAEMATLIAMRNEVLSDINLEEKRKKQVFPPIVFSKNNLKNGISVKIPYEILGFYLEPQIKPTLIDNMFFYSSLLLGSIVTVFTFIWGVI